MVHINYHQCQIKKQVRNNNNNNNNDNDYNDDYNTHTTTTTVQLLQLLYINLQVNYGKNYLNLVHVFIELQTH